MKKYAKGKSKRFKNWQAQQHDPQGLMVLPNSLLYVIGGAYLVPLPSRKKD